MITFPLPEDYKPKPAPAISSIVGEYLSDYRQLIDSEIIDDQNILISFPVHYSGHHRVEVTITHLPNGSFLISDMARTIDELRDAGYAMTSPMRKRLLSVANISGLKIIDNYLLLESSQGEIGK